MIDERNETIMDYYVSLRFHELFWAEGNTRYSMLDSALLEMSSINQVISHKT